MNKIGRGASQNPPNTAGERSQDKWKVLGVVIFGVFMIILDTTVVNVAFQTIRQEFGGELNDSQWILSIYVLALGISTPLAGFLGDRFSVKKVYLGGLGLFVLGSLLCGLAPSLNTLIAARAIQGLGGGIAMPLGTALLLGAFPAEEQGMALGVFGIAALVAPAIGPILGGWLVDMNLWRAIFFINPPIGLAGILLGLSWLPERKSERRPDIDVWGVITEILGFGAILYGASVAADVGWTNPVTLTWFGIGIVGLIAFAYVELYVSKYPLLDLRLYANRLFLNASLLGYVSTVALFGAEFLMPVYLQALRGLSALQTGLTLLPMAITGGIFVTLAGRLYDKVGPRLLMVAGFTTLIVNTWQLAQIQADTPIGWIMFLLALRGVSLGLTVQTTFVTALSVVRRSDLARGSSLSNATRLVVQSIGVAVLATVLASALSPQVRAIQDQAAAAETAGRSSSMRDKESLPENGVSMAAGTELPGICETTAAEQTKSFVLALEGQVLPAGGISRPAAASASPAAKTGTNTRNLQPPEPDLLRQACAENIKGFDRAYTVTFYAAFLALLLGTLLPGWPGKWEGRRDAPEIISGQ